MRINPFSRADKVKDYMLNSLEETVEPVHFAGQTDVLVGAKQYALAIALSKGLEDNELPAKLAKQVSDFGIHIKRPAKVEQSLNGVTTEAESMREAVKALRSHGEVATARVVLLSAALENPSDFKLWSDLANELAAAKDFATAANVYEQVWECKPENIYAAWNAGSLYLLSGDAGKARPLFGAALEAEPKNKRFLAFVPFLALADPEADLANKRDWERAADAIAEQPDWVRRRADLIVEQYFPNTIIGSPRGHHLEMVSTALEKMQLGRPLGEYFLGMEVDQISDATILRQLGKKAAQEGNDEEAIEVVNRLEGMTGENPRLWLDMAKIYAVLGKFDDSLKAIHHIDVSPEDLLSLVEGIPASKFSASMLPFMVELRSLSKNSADFNLLAGRLAFDSGALGVAADLLGQVVDLDPTDPEIPFKLGVTHIMMNQPNEAIASFDEAIKRNPDHVDALYYRASASFQTGAFADAADTLNTAIEIAGPKPQYLFDFAVSLRSLRDHKGAADALKMVLKARGVSAEMLDRALVMYFAEAALSGDEETLNDAVNHAIAVSKRGSTGFNKRLMLMTFLNNVERLEDAYAICNGLRKSSPNSQIVEVWDTYFAYRLGNTSALPKIDPDAIAEPILDLPSRMVSLIQSTHFSAISRWKDAIQCLTSIVTTDANFGGSSFLMGRALLNTKNYSAALPYLERMRDQGSHPGEGETLIKLAKLMGAKSRSNKTNVAEEFHIWQERTHEVSPLITVGVPAFNEARFLADALNSVWLQSFPFWQCVVVDDVSSDETPGIADDYAAMDRRFARVTHEENKGLAASRNTALKSANTSYVTFLDGDDFLTQSSLWRRAFTLNSKYLEPRVAGAYGGMRHCPELAFGEFPLVDNQTPGKVVTFANSNYEAPFNAHAPLLRTSVMNEFTGFDESMIYGAEDWECWLRMLRAGYQFVPTNIQCGLYRQKRGSMVRSLAPKHVEAAADIYGRLFTPQKGKKAEENVFSAAYPSVDASARFTKRSFTFAAMAELARNHEGASQIINRVPLTLEQIEAADISIKECVKAGVNRFFADTLHQVVGVKRAPYIQSEILRITDAFTEQLESKAAGGVEFDMDGDGDFLADGPEGSASTTTSSTGGAAAYMKLEETAHRYATKSKLEAMRNKHAGERCFIIGNGPSLNELDLSKIGNEAAIGVNGLFYKCRDIGWWPRYYCVEDSSVMKENLDQIIAFPAEQKFFPALYNRLHPHDDNVNFFVMNRGFYEAKSPNFSVPRFSTDFAQRAYCGQSVTYINLQLAFHLGFTEVYLIGMDFSYVIPKEFEKKGDMIVSTGEDPNHFHPDYFGKGKSWKDPKLEKVLANYSMAKLAYESSGRKIYNATAGGKLELFERRNYDELF